MHRQWLEKSIVASCDENFPNFSELVGLGSRTGLGVPLIHGRVVVGSLLWAGNPDSLLVGESGGWT